MSGNIKENERLISAVAKDMTPPNTIDEKNKNNIIKSANEGNVRDDLSVEFFNDEMRVKKIK